MQGNLPDIRRGKLKNLLNEKQYIRVMEASNGLSGLIVETYVDAGADGIMIHSYKSDGEEITSFLTRFKKGYPDVIVIVVPTTYSKFTERQLSELGANVIIYANHLLRSAYPAMLRIAEKILEDECCEEASNEYCLSMEEILKVIRG